MPVDALVGPLVEQYGVGAVTLVVLYRRIARVEDAVDELREHVDANAERIRYDPRNYPRRRRATDAERTAAEVSSTRSDD